MNNTFLSQLEKVCDSHMEVLSFRDVNKISHIVKGDTNGEIRRASEIPKKSFDCNTSRISEKGG